MTINISKWKVAINHKQIKEELLNRIRSSDIISISIRGVTTTTDTFVATSGQTEFILSNDGIKNIREVRINTVAQTALIDYTYTLTSDDPDDDKIITLTTGATLNDDVEIDYDYSSTGDHIYDDFPLLPKKAGDKFPWIGFDIGEETTELQSFNRVLYQSNLPFKFTTYGVGRNQTEDLATSLRNFLISIRQDLVRLEYIEPTGRGSIRPLETITDKKIFKKDIRFKGPFEFEEI